MEYLLEYSGAAVLLVVGFSVMFASLIVAAHGSPNPLAGITCGAVGLGICLGSYRVVRNLPRERIFRTALNVVLLFGALSLVFVAVDFGYERLFRTTPSQIPAEYENARFIYGFAMGGLSLATLWLLNARICPRR